MTTIVILGAGFSGIGVVQALESYKKKHNLTIHLVSNTNYVMFQPMLPGVAAGSIEANHIINPIRQLCKHTIFHRGNVDAIDTQKKVVTVVEKDIKRQHHIQYDHLVIAMGLCTDLSNVPGMTEHALPMKTLGDAIVLRNEVINKLEMAAVETDMALKKRLLTFAFIGGGFSGIETMGEVGDMIKSARIHYPTIQEKDIRLLLIHSGHRILKELSNSIALFAQKKLIQRGMELHLNTRVTEVTSDTIVLSSGDVIPTNTVICTTGNAPHKPLIDLGILTKNGRLPTNETFHLRPEKKFRHIWAVGDCASTPNVYNNNKPCPTTAQFAVRMGPVLAKNIIRSITNKPLKPFKFKAFGQLAIIGHLCGVAEVLGIQFSGVLAFFMWRAVYWLKLPGIGCKLRVLVDWFVHSLFPIDITQIDLHQTEKINRSYYQADSYVFRQGDISDAFYVIENGCVDVIQEQDDGTQTILARLSAGDSFGEIGLMEQTPRSASVRCTTPVGLLMINRHDFEALTASYSTLRNQLHDRIHHIRQANSKSIGRLTKKLASLTPSQTNDSPIEAVEKPKPPPPEDMLSDQQFIDQFHHRLTVTNQQNLIPLKKELEFELSRRNFPPDLLKAYGNLLHHMNDIPNAIMMYKQYLEGMPKDTTVMANLGDIYHAQKQFKACIKLLRQALVIDPSNEHILTTLASAYRHIGDYPQAKEILLQLGPTKNIDRLLLLAQCYLYQKELLNADRLLLQILNHSPHCIPATILLIQSFMQQSRYIDADAYLLKIMELDTAHPYKKTLLDLKSSITQCIESSIING